MTKTMLCIGHGYVASFLTPVLLAQGWQVLATYRTADKAQTLRDAGIQALIWPGADLAGAIGQASHVLTSVAPGPNGDPVLDDVTEVLVNADHLSWVGYLSTTGVYGDHGGGWVDEDTPLTPATRRGIARVRAEAAWQALNLPLHIFRLAGIYGPGRGPFEKVRAGTARQVIKPGQVFSRTHVEDIVQVLLASIDRPNPGAVYNVCDDDPAPPQDVLAHAAQLLNLPPPPKVAFEDAELSPMARSFYAESKRVRNDRIKDELGVSLKYPDYRSGLRAMLDRDD